jgi:hypothetical protein
LCAVIGEDAWIVSIRDIVCSIGRMAISMTEGVPLRLEDQPSDIRMTQVLTRGVMGDHVTNIEEIRTRLGWTPTRSIDECHQLSLSRSDRQVRRGFDVYASERHFLDVVLDVCIGR